MGGPAQRTLMGTRWASKSRLKEAAGTGRWRARYEAERPAPGGIRKGAAGYDITFLHPKSNDEFPIAGEGVLIELVQAPPEVIQAFSVSSP